MFPTSVGRRLVLIITWLVIIYVALLIYIAINTSTSALREVTEEIFEDQFNLLVNLISQQVDTLESQTNTLANAVNTRERWTSGEVRAFVIENFGSTASFEVTAVHIYRDNQPQIFTFDYLEPADLPAGMIMPINRTLRVDEAPQDFWPFSIQGDDPFWYGPVKGFDANYQDDVMVYAIPLSDPDGLVWIDVPLYVFENTVQSRVEAGDSATDREYLTLFTENRDLIFGTSASESLDSSFSEPTLNLISDLPPLGIAEQMNDPLGGDQRAFVISDMIPGTNWTLLSVIPDRSLSRALPAEAIAQLGTMTIVGIAILAFIVQRYIFLTVSQPLDRLSIASQEIGAGDLRYQIEYREREDEIGRLARALDDMKSNLARSYEQLEAWSTTLEQRVKERTREVEITRREAQVSAAELRAVYDESLLVVSAYQLQTILQTLVQRIYNLLDASYTAVWLLSDDRTQVRLVANTTNDKSRVGTTIGVDEGLVGRAISGGELLVVDDYPNWSGKLSGVINEHMHQAMAVPLIFSGEPIGAVIVGRKWDAHFFETNDQRLLRLFANLVSPAVRNAQLYVQRDEAVQEAERANQVKTRFLASVTHELRTPLNLVINNMDFMRIGQFGPVTEEQIYRLNQTIRSTEHLLYLINDLLDVSKIEAGEMELFIRESDLYTLIEDAIASTEVMLEQYGKVGEVDLVVNVDESIPPFPMDSRRVRQILVNLLSNAVKFTDEGSVTLSVQNREHYVRFDIIDTGMGVPEDEEDKLFEAFERTNRAKEKSIEGTGLGLPICKFLVEAHGGEITFKSQSGVGTTFTFTLPYKQKRETTDTQQMATILNRVRNDSSNSR